METLSAIGRLLLVIAGQLEAHGEGGQAARWLRWISGGIDKFGDNPAKFKAAEERLRQKTDAGEPFSPDEFDELERETDELTDRADDAAAARGLETSSEGSPVGHLDTDEAVAALSDLEPEQLDDVLQHDGRKTVRDAADALRNPPEPE